MIKEIIKPLIVTNNEINNNMSKIIDAFVEFYGEYNKENIKNKFSSVLILKKYNSDSLNAMINNIYNELYRKVFEIDSKIILNYDFNKIYEAIESNNVYDSELIYFVGPSLTTSEFLELYHEGKDEKLILFFKLFKRVKNIIKAYEVELANNTEEECKIRKEFYEQLINKYKRVLPTRLLEKFDLDNQNSECSEFIHLFFGYDSINYESCFSPNSEELLNDNNISDVVKDIIKSERVKIFDLYGINHKDTYEEYLEDEHTLAILNNLLEVSSEMDKEKESLSKLQFERIVKSQKNYKDNIRILEEKGYLSNTLDYNSYYDSTSELLVNFIVDGSILVFSPIILLDIFSKNNDIDCTMIHELNHLYECNVIIEEYSIKCITGWDEFLGSIKLNKDGRREYELINEFINEEISKEIFSILIRNNNCIFSYKEDNKYLAIYTYLDFLLLDFYNEFKDVIIESRKESNINILFNRVGEKNFDLLNELVTSFNLMYGLSKESHELVEYSINNPNDEKSKTIIEFINIKNTIIENMKKHSIQRVRRNNILI